MSAEESAAQIPRRIPVETGSLRSQGPPNIHAKVSVEQQEEAKLRAKYPQGLKGGGSAFLQKRLQKGQKYFDSGEYNMAKSKIGKQKVIFPQHPTGDAIPTPENLPPRKLSQTQSRLVAGASSEGAAAMGDLGGEALVGATAVAATGPPVGPQSH